MMQITSILLKKWIPLGVVFISLSGCAMTNVHTQDNSTEDAQFQMRRFDEAKSLTASEIPQIYDVARLKAGSKVKIKYISNSSGKSYFTTKVLRDIRSSDGQKLYVTDSTVADHTFTFQEDGFALSKIISPEEDIKPLVDYKIPNRDSLPAVIIRDTLGAGIVGGLVSGFDYARMKKMNREIAEHIKGTRIETKVIDFKFISNETLKIAGKDILCRVYQVHSLMRQTRPPMKDMPNPTVIMDQSEQIWISDEVPFGLAKRKTTVAMHMCMGENKKSRIKIASSTQSTQETAEVEEFNY